jgi:hypothetical protein
MDMPLGSPIATAAASLAFILAGNARVTLVSEKTGARFTYRVRQPQERGPHFVSVLVGSDNDRDFAFLGTIFERKVFKHGRKSKISPNAPSANAFGWAWRYLGRGESPPDCQVWHEGTCGRCGRALTDPTSISLGMGPKCRAGGSDGL